MDSSRRGKLSPLQLAVLDAFFTREAAFWLSGGGALVGYHLGHRETSDLDLFTADPDAFDRIRPVVRDLAGALGLELQVVQEAPGFRRYALLREGEGLVLDLVLEQTVQLHPDKPVVEGVRVDPADEVLANKLTALVGRMEERDLVDVLFLERSGLRVEDLLDVAHQKDGGCTPATLAWLLSEITIPDGVELPGGVVPAELRDWLAELIQRLRKAAYPGEAPSND
jgi:hypothetical protein